MDEKEVNSAEYDKREPIENPTPTMGARLDNFWYHYKWHTIVAAFLVIVFVIITVSMCNKVDYDVHITYAGDYLVGKNEAGYGEALKSLKRASEDFDGDGEVNISFTNYYISKEDYSEDYSKLQDSMWLSDYYVFFLSESLYKDFSGKIDGGLFTSLEPYVGDAAGIRYASSDKAGIYLNSMKISKLPSLCDFPDDTVVCLKKKITNYDKDANEENFEIGEKVIKNMIFFE